MVELVKVYSTPTCPWCKKVKQFLQDNNIQFHDYNVAADEAARKEMIDKTGKVTVPVIDIDGDIVIGYDEDWLREKLLLPRVKG